MSGPTTASASSHLPARLIWSARSPSITIGCSRISNGSPWAATDDGTAIGSAIAAGVNRLRLTPAKSKVVILLTDGVNNTGKISPLAAAEAAKALGVKIYTIGVGVRGEAPIPVRDAAATCA